MVIFVFARKCESMKMRYKYFIINNELSVLGHGWGKFKYRLFLSAVNWRNETREYWVKNRFPMLLEIIYEWISIPAKTYHVWISKAAIKKLTRMDFHLCCCRHCPLWCLLRLHPCRAELCALRSRHLILLCTRCRTLSRKQNDKR